MHVYFIQICTVVFDNSVHTTCFWKTPYGFIVAYYQHPLPAVIPSTSFLLPRYYRGDTAIPIIMQLSLSPRSTDSSIDRPLCAVLAGTDRYYAGAIQHYWLDLGVTSEHHQPCRPPRVLRIGHTASARYAIQTVAWWAIGCHLISWVTGLILILYSD